MKILWVLMLSGLVFCLAAAVTEVRVTASKARIFSKQDPGNKDEPVSSASRGEVLKVIDQKGEWVKVKNAAGQEGWVSKAEVKPIGSDRAGGQAFMMDEAKVQGFLENPQAVYILDMADPNFKPIQLNRSFGDELAGNIDKETNQRLNDPNLKPEE